MTNQTDAGKSLDLTEILPVMTRREWDCEINPPNCSKSQYDKWYESIHASILGVQRCSKFDTENRK